jgi:hypothetical protein
MSEEGNRDSWSAFSTGARGAEKKRKKLNLDLDIFAFFFRFISFFSAKNEEKNSCPS